MIGVVLHFYGSPPTLADVREFYARIVHREPSEEKVARLLEQYRAYGRPAPLGATVERIQRFLEERLNRPSSAVKLQAGGQAGPREGRYLVRRAGKNAPPWVGDAVAELVEEGVTAIVSLPLTPFGSKLGSENYHRSVRRALEALGCRPVDLSPGASPLVDEAAMEGRTVGVIPVERWYWHELFLKASALRLGQAVAWLPEDLRPFTAVVFTIHSMPEAEVGEVPRLPDQYRLWAEETARRVGISHWMLSYRSAPSGSDKWLGPDVREVIREVAARGFKAVVVCPVPTLIENVEVFQEAGEDAQEAARQCGLEFVRTELLNDSADMLDLLESLVREAVDQAQPTGGASRGAFGRVR